MKGLSILLCLLFLGGGFFFAQEAGEAVPDTIENPQGEVPQEDIADEPPPAEDEAQPDPEEGDTMPPEDDTYIEDEEFIYRMNQKGDQFIKIGAMVDISLRPSLNQLKVGGSGTLGYMFFLTGNFAVGGDATFMWMPTVGKNMFTCIPLMAKVMYQFTLHKFEFPITLGIGGAFENYVDDTYFSLIIKPEVGVFFRYSPSWSAGINVGCNLMPQWTKNSSYFGVIMDTGVTVRYHF